MIINNSVIILVILVSSKQKGDYREIKGSRYVSLVRYNEKLVILMGTKQIRIHDFRHSCASLLINNGANITMVATYLGHTKVDETLNTYSHMFKDKLNIIVDIINML